MNSFHVWVRPLGETCRVRVDGIRNAEWLLAKLAYGFVFKTAEPIKEDPHSSCCSFRVAYGSLVSYRGLEKLLAGLGEVVMMTDPA